MLKDDIMKVATRVHGKTRMFPEETILSLRILAENSEQKAQKDMHDQNFDSARRRYHLAVLFLDKAVKLSSVPEITEDIIKAKDSAMRNEYIMSIAIMMRRE